MSMLCTPVLDDSGDLLAVIQCTNRSKDVQFKELDQLVMQQVAQQSGSILHNVHTFQAEVRTNQRTEALLDVSICLDVSAIEC